MQVCRRSAVVSRPAGNTRLAAAAPVPRIAAPSVQRIRPCPPAAAASADPFPSISMKDLIETRGSEGLGRFKTFGNVGRDLELRQTANGKYVVNTSLACTTRLADGTERTQWFKLIFWDALAERAAKTISKGNRIAVVGIASVDKWPDRETGPNEEAKITVFEVAMVERRQQTA